MINQLQEKYQLSILTLLCVVSIFGISPFVVIRYLEGNFTAVLIDLALILGIVALVVFAHYSKKVRVVSLLAAVFINCGVVTIVVVNGFPSFLWVYPVFATTFILVKPIEAFVLNVITGAALATFADIFAIVSLDSYLMTMLMLAMCIYVYASHSAKQFKLLKTLNTVDALTGALNRRALSSDMTAALSYAERSGQQQLLALLDLDHFKKVNDKFGHAAGDQVLKDLVSITTAHIRKYDRFYRFGGEEFVLLIGEISPQQQHAFIQNLRIAIKQELKTPAGDEVTVSFGVAAWCAGTTQDSWLKRADDALYLAKARGRDCAVFSDESASSCS